MVTLWTVASILRPGYDQLTQKGSELGTGPNSIVMNLNFGITGILIVVFALGLGRITSGTRMSSLGATLLLAAGASEAIVAGFPCDPGCPAAMGTFSQNIHLGIALVFFSSIALAPLLIGIGIGGNPFWKPYGSYSKISGIASLVLGVAFSLGTLSSFQFTGLLERAFLGLPLLWIEIMAVHALSVPS